MNTTLLDTNFIYIYKVSFIDTTNYPNLSSSLFFPSTKKKTQTSLFMKILLSPLDLLLSLILACCFFFYYFMEDYAFII